MLLVLLGGAPVDPPLGYPVAPAALTVKDGFLVWSLGEVGFGTLLPLTIVGALTVGTAGVTAGLPFTGERESEPTCWFVAELPTAMGSFVVSICACEDFFVA